MLQGMGLLPESVRASEQLSPSASGGQLVSAGPGLSPLNTQPPAEQPDVDKDAAEPAENGSAPSAKASLAGENWPDCTCTALLHVTNVAQPCGSLAAAVPQPLLICWQHAPVLTCQCVVQQA